MRFPRILQVARMGHPILQKPAELVTDPTENHILELIEDMKTTVDHIGATGIAAPQVFVPLRIIVYRLRPNHAPEDLPKEQYPWTVMINPHIIETSEALTFRWESCLSIPDMTGFVPRHDHIICQYMTPEGKIETKEARGYKARVIQHECDHINGILYSHRLKDHQQLGFREEIERNKDPASSH